VHRVQKDQGEIREKEATLGRMAKKVTAVKMENGVRQDTMDNPVVTV